MHSWTRFHGYCIFVKLVSFNINNLDKHAFSIINVMMPNISFKNMNMYLKRLETYSDVNYFFK